MIKYAGQRIEGLDPHIISRLGIAYVPEGGGPFRDMSVRESLEMGAYHSIGLSPLLVDEFFHIIHQLRDDGITVLLIEQNVHKSLEIADRAYVLENGCIVLEGRSQDLLQEERIREAYLGL